MIIQRIDSISLGKVLGLLHAILGLMIGGFVALISLAGVGVGGRGGNEEMAAVLGMGLFAVVILPLINGVFGFVGGIISALLYNVVASLVGGVEIETDGYRRARDE